MNNKNTMIFLALFLGIVIVAISNGIILPARELIQNSFDVWLNTGILMITIYTIVFVISIPILSNMAGRYGLKKIYVFSIALFGLGSFLCGLSFYYGGFSYFVICLVLQAIGAGGIIPVSYSIISNIFNKRKSGMTLGLICVIYGISAMIGPAIGSGILSYSSNWGLIFFINVPISILIISLSFFITSDEIVVKKSVDILGAIILLGIFINLMYALSNIIVNGLMSVNVYPFLLIAAILVPVFYVVEKRAEDAFIKSSYFKNKQMLVIIMLSILVGIGIMGIVLIPQFAENIFKMKPGTGGYFVTFLALFSGLALLISKKLINIINVRMVMAIGFIIMIAGTLFLGLNATSHMEFINVAIGLIFIGFGFGFVMIVPFNYLVLKYIQKEDGIKILSSIALSLSIGIAIAPSFLLIFLVQASKKLQISLVGLFYQILPFADDKIELIKLSIIKSNVMTVVDNVKVVEEQIKYNSANIPVEGIEDFRNIFEATFQRHLNNGYKNMFITLAIVLFIGLITTCFLRSKTNGLEDIPDTKSEVI